MDNQIQLSSGDNQSLELTDKQVGICQVVFHVNQLTAYPLSDLQISDWAKSLDELYPELDTFRLRTIINEMKLGKLEWDARLGIQNLTKHLNYDPNQDFLSRL